MDYSNVQVTSGKRNKNPSIHKREKVSTGQHLIETMFLTPWVVLEILVVTEHSLLSPHQDVIISKVDIHLGLSTYLFFRAGQEPRALYTLDKYSATEFTPPYIIPSL